MSSKQDIIGKIYFDRSGYGSKQTTLRDAKEKDKNHNNERCRGVF